MQSEGKKPNVLPWPVLDTEDEYDDKHSSWNICYGSPTVDDTDAEEEEKRRDERREAKMAAFKSQQTKK